MDRMQDLQHMASPTRHIQLDIHLLDICFVVDNKEWVLLRENFVVDRNT